MTIAAPVEPARHQDAHAAPSIRAFLLLAVQVTGLVVAAWFWKPEMFRIALVWGIGFAVHYWAPFDYKKALWVGLGAIGLYVALPPELALLMAGLGLLPYPIIRARLPLPVTIAALLLVGVAAVVIGRHMMSSVPLPLGPVPEPGPEPVPVPGPGPEPGPGPGPEPEPGPMPMPGPALGDMLVMFFGGMFAIRLILYVHYIRRHDACPALLDYLAYFFALPFLGSPFPFVDYGAMMDNYYRRAGTAIAQEGLKRIYAGGVQLIAFHYALQIVGPPPMPMEVQSLAELCTVLFLGYMMCVMFSAHGHLVVGMCLLFGYDLPPLHRWYVLARGPLDFWRRNNIYLKDMMQTLVYLPVYFRASRRYSDGVAQLLAIAAVFVAVAASEIWVRAWMEAGRAPISELSATSFRAVLAIACVFDAWFHLRRRKTKPGPVRVAAGIALTLVFMALALQLEWLRSLSVFIDMIIWWD